MAHQQYLLEQLFDLIGVITDEFRQSGEVGHHIAGQGFEDDVGLAAPLHLPAGVDALGVGEQNDLQQDGRIIGQTAGVFVAVFGVEDRQVQLVLDQVVHRVFESAGLELVLVIDHDHGVLIVVVVLEAGHGDDSLSFLFIQSYQTEGKIFGVFLRPQRPVPWRRTGGGPIKQGRCLSQTSDLTITLIELNEV